MSRTSTTKGTRRRTVDLLLLALVVLIFAGSMLIGRVVSPATEFGGTDAKVSELIEEEGHEPWFTPIFQPGSGEVESGLFALQAALGGIALGYCVGRLHGRRKAERSQ